MGDRAGPSSTICASAPRRRTRARALVLVLTVAAAAASVVAIFVELGGASRRKNDRRARRSLALSTVVLSWLFIHAIFAFHYAHEFYGEAKAGTKAD